MKNRNLMQHWPVLLLGVGVLFLFSGVLTIFTVNEIDFVVLKRFGEPIKKNGKIKVYDSGYHFKLPFIDRVWKADNRLHNFELVKGNIEQIPTADNHQVIVSTYAWWKISHENPENYIMGIQTADEVEKKLSNWIRNARSAVISRYRFDQLVNTNAGEVKLVQISEEITKMANEESRKQGIEIGHVGIKHLGVPATVTGKVFERMTADRMLYATRYRDKGTSDKAILMSEADKDSSIIIAKAKADALKIKGNGDREAARNYKDFSENESLAVFLRKLKLLEEILGKEDTLILSTGMDILSILNGEALDSIITEELEQHTKDK